MKEVSGGREDMMEGGNEGGSGGREVMEGLMKGGGTRGS